MSHCQLSGVFFEAVTFMAPYNLFGQKTGLSEVA
jgi:hypothetical protein